MQPLSPISYYQIGFKLIFTTGLKRFVFIPMTINLIIFSIAFYYLYLQLEQVLEMVKTWVPDYLSWITHLILPIFILSILISFSYLFATVTNWIAAPFNGLLAEKVEHHLKGQSATEQGSTFGDLIKDLPRAMSREWQKLKYYLPRAIGFLLISFFIPLIGPLIWFLFTAWMMAIQYCDYVFDNHKINFDEMKYALKQEKTMVFGFGGLTTVLAMTPFVNLVLMPVAICAATAMSVDRFDQLD